MVRSLAAGKYSLITVHERREVKGMDAAGVLPTFTEIAVHDAWAPYDTCTAATHALCGAHVLRELQAVPVLAEQNPGADQWCRATQTGDALRTLNTLITDALTSNAGIDRSRSPTLCTATAAPPCSAPRPPAPGRTR